MYLPERLEGAIYGHLCGDALGVPYEFLAADRIGEVEWKGGGHHGQPPGTWSDDGALMLALLDSLLTVGFDPADQGRRALAWKDEGAYAAGGQIFDIGISTSRALHALRCGVPADQAGASDAKGNGSLMRILPLPLVFRDVDVGALADMAVGASRVTHGSAEAQIACALYALIVRALLGGEADRARVLDEARSSLRSILAERGLAGSAEAAEPGNALAAMGEFEAWTGRGGRGRVVDSFWSAWDAFAGAPDYVTAVETAVRYGEDTDTTACIAGGLAGVFFGVDEIPARWRFGLRDREVAQALVDRLLETDVSQFDGTPWKTSHANPLRVDLLDVSGTDLAADGGRAGITFLPGKSYVGLYTGPHWRDADLDAARLKELEVDVLLLLVEDHELATCHVQDVARVLPARGVELIRHPIPDPALPYDDDAYRALITGLLQRVRSGETLAIACRGGLDRAGMTSACLLREAGLDADTAIDRVHAARRHSLTMPDQLGYVRDWPHA